MKKKLRFRFGKWFAWHPVETDANGWVWLRYVSVYDVSWTQPFWPHFCRSRTYIGLHK